MNLFRIVLGLAAVACMASGCDPAEVDATDPGAVAKAFFSEVRGRDAEGASSFVLPAQRRGCIEIVGSDDAPEIPRGFDVEVGIRGDSGTAVITGTSIRVDLRLESGRWWVCI
jgi:hypothetical protein